MLFLFVLLFLKNHNQLYRCIFKNSVNGGWLVVVLTKKGVIVLRIVARWVAVVSINTLLLMMTLVEKGSYQGPSFLF